MNGNNHQLMPRDLILLKAVGLLRVIDREQAKEIGKFNSATRLNYRLAALRSLGLLKQFFVGLGPGTRKAVFCLTKRGAQIAGVQYQRTRFASDATVGFDPFLIHRVAVGDVYVAVTRQSLPEGVRTSAWRFFETPLTANTRLIPDGYFELHSRETVRGVFLEMDMGTETARVWKKKVAEYLSFAVSGGFQERFGISQFRVLVITTSAKRLQNLAKVISRITPKLFWLTTLDEFKTNGPWSPIWSRPADSNKHSLFLNV
jgi:hypothetical protein